MTDQRIIELFFARSDQAVTELERKYGARLLPVARNLTGDLLDAEECVNDVLLTAWNSIPPQRPKPLSGWLYSVTRNIAMNRYRANTAAKRGGGEITRALDELENIVSGPGTPEEALARKELARALNRFLSGLPRTDRALFLGRYYAGEPYHVLALRLELTEEHCRMKIARLRKRLRRQLEKDGVL